MRGEFACVAAVWLLQWCLLLNMKREMMYQQKAACTVSESLYLLPLVQIDRRQAMEMFEHDCMQAVGLLGDNQAAERWKRQEVRFNTKTAYTQNK